MFRRGAPTAIVIAAVATLGFGKPPEDRLAKAGEAFRRGDYEEALRLASAQATKAPDQGAPIVLAARAEQALGRHADARRRLDRAAERAPDDLALRGELMRLLDATGDAAALKPLVDRTYADWGAKRVDRGSEADVLAVAIAARLDNNWQDARDVLVTLTDAHPKARDALLELGTIRLSKYEVDAAESSFRAMLAIDPGDPDAHALLGRVALERGYNAGEAEKEIAAALSVNPRHAPALRLRGEMAIDAEEFDRVREIAVSIRKVNPVEPRASFLLATRALVLDDRPEWERERAARLAARPGDGDFFAQVAEALVRQRRYDEAREVAREGVALDPKHAGCLASLGTTLLRLGEEREGLEFLRRAWKRDPYNLRTFNLLNLYDKVIPVRYVEIVTAHLRFRVEPRVRAAIENVVVPFLEETYARYAAKYKVEPPGPIVIELYGDPAHYAVRTVGLPALAVQGVCFGRVVTSTAPTNGSFNWGMVLAHELAHVFALHISRSRVPRWFTEGLSEVETMRLRAEWSRHNDRELWAAMKAGRLPALGDISQSFIHARSAGEAMRAYGHAAAAVDFLDRRFGFPRLRDALAAYGRGERGAQVLEKLAGMKADALEKEFRADLAARTRRFETQFLPATLSSVEPAGDPKRPGPAAGDPTALAGAGLRRLSAGDLPAARELLERARTAKDAGQDPLVIFLAGEIGLRARDAAMAERHFQALLDFGKDGYDVRVRAALAAIHQKKPDAAETHLRRAIEQDPDSVEPRVLLAELLGDHGRRDDRAAELEGVLRLEPQNRKAAKEAVLAAARLGKPGRVLDLAPTAVFIDPADADVHAAFGRALASTGKPRDAAKEFELALLFASADAPALHRTLADLYDKLGDRKKASAHRTATAAPAPSAPPGEPPAE